MPVHKFYCNICRGWGSKGYGEKCFDCGTYICMRCYPSCQSHIGNEQTVYSCGKCLNKIGK